MRSDTLPNDVDCYITGCPDKEAWLGKLSLFKELLCKSRPGNVKYEGHLESLHSNTFSFTGMASDNTEGERTCLLYARRYLPPPAPPP